MKKIIIMLLSMTLIVVCLVVQVFSADVTDEYDEYVFCELGNIITAYGGIDQDNVTVGTGIDVYNSRNEIRFYPVYICGNLEYILELYKENSIIGFAFSPNSAQAIDETMGKLPFSTCSTIISNGKYIMAISATYTFELGMYHVRGYHATAIIDTPSTNVLKMFDPHGSSSTVIISNINYYSPSFTSGGLVYTWDSGYYSYLTY